jgi:hypothetical protein
MHYFEKMKMGGYNKCESRRMEREVTWALDTVASLPVSLNLLPILNDATAPSYWTVSLLATVSLTVLLSDSCAAAL